MLLSVKATAEKRATDGEAMDIGEGKKRRNEKMGKKAKKENRKAKKEGKKEGSNFHQPKHL